MRSQRTIVCTWLCLAAFGLAASGAAPLATAPATAPADPSSDRLTFLILRLSSAEESLKAIDAALKMAGYKIHVAYDKAAAYQKGNELMDRQGGAPVPWDKFYGKTARAFTTPWNDPIRRPSQFDYLYRANNQLAAKAKDEVAALGQKVDVLLARRQQLELERITLWATISLESITGQDLKFKPLFRLQLVGGNPAAATQPTLDPHVASLDGLIVFLRSINASAGSAEDALATDPAKALGSLKPSASAAYASLEEAMFEASQTATLSPAESQQIKDMMATAKHLRALAQDITEAFDLGRQSEAAGDDMRKQTFDGALQESLVGLADGSAELEAAITKTASTWGVHGQAGLERKDAALAAVAGATPPAAVAGPTPAAVGGPASPGDARAAIAPSVPDTAPNRTATISRPGGTPFEEKGPEGTILVGFEFTKEHFNGSPIVKSLAPIYRGPNGEVMGKPLGKPSGAVTRVVARDGYGVLAIEGACGRSRIKHLTLHFVRITGGAIVPTDAYDAPMFGVSEGGSKTLLTAQKPVIGVYGASGADINSIGLISEP